MKPLLMGGTAFPIGKLNKNGWGIPDDESVIESVIETLKTSKVRICAASVDNKEHHCDFSDDDTSNIGEIRDAWRENDNINVKVAVTNENAINKFETNEWGKTWSPYGFAEQLDPDGWVRGKFINKSLTFVSNPAWDEDGGNILYASKKGLHSYVELEASSNKVFDDLGDIVSDDKLTGNKGNEPNGTQNDDIDPYSELIKQLTEKVEFESHRNDALDAQFKDLLENGFSKKDEEPKEDPPSTDPVGFIPEDKVNAMIKNAMEQERNRVEKEIALTEYKRVYENIGLEVTPTDVERLSDNRITASDIERELDSVKQVYSKYNKTAIGELNEPNYSANNKDKKKPDPKDYQGDVSGWTLGTPDQW